jgi:NADH-quinone oxidoreductase subunit E
MLAGADKIVKRFEERLGIKLGETSEDGCITLREAECLAACVNAPVCQVDDAEYVENLTTDKVDSMIDTMRGDA